MKSSSKRPTSLSANAVQMAVLRPKQRRRPRATLYSPPPSQTLNSRAQRTRPSPGSRRSMISPSARRSYLQEPAGLMFRTAMVSYWLNGRVVTIEIRPSTGGQIVKAALETQHIFYTSFLEGLLQKQLRILKQTHPHPGPLPIGLGGGRIVLCRQVYPTALEAAGDRSGPSLSRRTGGSGSYCSKCASWAASVFAQTLSRNDAVGKGERDRPGRSVRRLAEQVVWQIPLTVWCARARAGSSSAGRRRERSRRPRSPSSTASFRQ